MFQGTGSDVGKSLLVAGLCRLFARRGLRVLPFKAQNMSNNAAVADDGGEIGRAQWLQALAAGVPPSVHMNPVLLKPQSDKTSQVIVCGKAVATMGARDYQNYRPQLLSSVMESYHTLAQNADLILLEGAGSPAEINLRSGDIANMGLARALQLPVVMVGDIERGGVIASLVGTHAVLDEDDKKLIKAFIINKFRGDASLFASGADEIARRTSWLDLGLVRHFPELSRLPQEDSMALGQRVNNAGNDNAKLRVCVLKTPHIANFDDIDPLVGSENVEVLWIGAGETIPADANLVIIAGSKSTIADLEFIKTQGWDIDLAAHRRRGGRIMGICGGYQMLGKTITDPSGSEGIKGKVAGLGLLEVDTVFFQEKTVKNWCGEYLQSIPITGYEIHLGKTTGADASRPLFFAENGAPEGAISEDGLVMGSYIHGAFANDDFRESFLSAIGGRKSSYNYKENIEKILNSWADVLGDSIAIEELLKLAKSAIK